MSSDGENPYKPSQGAGEEWRSPDGATSVYYRRGSGLLRLVGMWTYGEAAVLVLLSLASAIFTLLDQRWLHVAFENRALAAYFVTRFVLCPVVAVLLAASGWALSRLDGWGLLGRAALSLFVTLILLTRVPAVTRELQYDLSTLTEFPGLAVANLAQVSFYAVALAGHAAIAVSMLRLKPGFHEGWAWSAAAPPIPPLNLAGVVVTPIIGGLLASGTFSALHAMVVDLLGLVGPRS